MAKRKFVVVVDTQVDFMLKTGALYVPGAETLINPITDFIASLRSCNTAGVLFTFDTHTSEDYPQSEEAKQFPPHCYVGTRGWENVIRHQAVSPLVPVHTLTKDVFDMWAGQTPCVVDQKGASLPRDEFFLNLFDVGVRQVTLVGVARDYCVRYAAEGFRERGFEVTVPSYLTKGISDG